MTRERVETLIIGGGQAGLAMSHMLSQHGCRHLVLERGRIAERWRTERWDGLRFQFPNWSVKLPAFSLSHADPDAFATSRDIVDFLTAYADFIAAPIRCGHGPSLRVDMLIAFCGHDRTFEVSRCDRSLRHRRTRPSGPPTSSKTPAVSQSRSNPPAPFDR